MFSAEIGLIVSIVLGIAFAAVVFGTFGRNKWGINAAQAACPNCHEKLPRFRKPTSLKQALWGGYTCPSCHREIDKWGREISA